MRPGEPSRKIPAQTLAQWRTTTVLRWATSVMNDVLDLHQNNESDGPTQEELVQSLNTDQARVYEHVKSHLEHQLTQKKQCSCTDLKPLHMFVSGVGGTGKSFLIKTVCALVTKMWEDETQSTLCAVTAPTGLAAYNVGGVTIHRLLQLPIEHEGRGAGYWKLAKDALKIMRACVSAQAQTAHHRRTSHTFTSEIFA